MADTATYDLLGSLSLAGVKTGTFTSISGSYTDLKVVFTGTSANGGIGFRFNSDTATNYSATLLKGNSAAAQSTSWINKTYLPSFGDSGAGLIQKSVVILDIFSYANSSYKATLQSISADDNGANQGTAGAMAGLWRSTSAITSVAVYKPSGANNFDTGATAYLYGIKAA